MDLKCSDYHKFHIESSPENAASALAKRIIAQTEISIRKKGRCVWAVSGGSTILKLYDALTVYADQIKEFGEDLVVIWVDERVVPHSHKKSNFGTAYNYFWEKIEGTELLPVPYYQNLEESRQEYEKILNRKGIKPGSIDITILGMGSDGHTASLFPQNPALKEHKKMVVAVEDPTAGNPRISMTFSFINSSESIFLLFYGREKAETFRKAVCSGSIYNFPILGIDRNKMEIYTEQHLKTEINKPKGG